MMKNALVQREVKIHPTIGISMDPWIPLLEGTQLRVQYFSVTPSLRRNLKSHLEWPPAPGWSRPCTVGVGVVICPPPKKKSIFNWWKLFWSNQIKRPMRVVTHQLCPWIHAPTVNPSPLLEASARKNQRFDAGWCLSTVHLSQKLEIHWTHGENASAATPSWRHPGVCENSCSDQRHYTWVRQWEPTNGAFETWTTGKARWRLVG